MKRVLSFLIILSFAPLAHAEPQKLGTYEGWGAYVNEDNGQKTCYVAAKPAKSEGAYKKRGAVFAQVTHRPSEHHDNIFNILGGYRFKAGAPATLQIGDQTFHLFTHGDAAFAQDEDDAKIIAAMRAGDIMVLKAASSHGTDTVDSFALKGLETAYQEMSKACGVEIEPPRKKAKRVK